MKQLLIAAIATVFWIGSSVAEEPTLRSKPVQCADPKAIFEHYVDSADLTVEFIAVGQVASQSGEVTPQAVVFFHNAESGKWMFMEGDKDYACVIGLGDKLDLNIDHDTIISLFTGEVGT